MKVIFLDIDGVLNNHRTVCRTPDGFVGISSNLTTRLREIVKATDAKIVLTSTWKECWNKKYTLCKEDGKYLVRKLHHKGLEIIDKTEDAEGYFYRGEGILSYIKENNIEKFVVLDDFEFDFKKCELLDHLVLTDPIEGLTDEDVEKAIDILKGE